ncbi:MAG: DUF45 domain-containing protein [Candidatus Azambacteria bacterium]|nr:DUF45 domain-containing protein [Candidatus Azambacteria bacterium]
MKKQITLQNKKVSYILRKSKKAQRMRITVYCNGAIVVTMPHNLQETIVEKFIREKAQWLFSKVSYFKQFKGRQIVRYGRKDYLKHRDKAQTLVEERIGHFNKRYGFCYNKIKIKNQKTCWGSCSKKRNLNFNYKILFLSEKTRDYIIAHELCHLKELNHSRNFWGLVAKTFPEWREIKKELKNNTLNLH